MVLRRPKQPPRSADQTEIQETGARQIPWPRVLVTDGIQQVGLDVLMQRQDVVVTVA